VSEQVNPAKKNGKRGEQQGRSAHPIGTWRTSSMKNGSSETSINSLAVRLKAGSHEAAAELVDRYYVQIYLYMRRLGHNCQSSEDLTQESFLAAWQHINQLKDDRSLNGWLYRIAGNVSRLYWRRHKGRKAGSIDGYDVADDSESGREIGNYEDYEYLKAAVDQLSDKLKETVILHYMQHLTIVEAAQAAGIREGTFKSRLNRALTTLRKQMK
jgi:RNA polymerase sigma-70 factor (ECF subfamily)